MWILNLKIESTGGLSYWCGFHFASYAGGKKKYSQLTLNWKNLRSQQCLLQNPSATQQLCYFQHLWLRLHGDQLNGFLRWHQMAADAIIPTTGDRNMIGADRDNGEISSNSLRIDSQASGDHLKCGLWFNSVGKSNKWDVSLPPHPPQKERQMQPLAVNQQDSLTAATSRLNSRSRLQYGHYSQFLNAPLLLCERQTRLCVSEQRQKKCEGTGTNRRDLLDGFPW